MKNRKAVSMVLLASLTGFCGCGDQKKMENNMPESSEASKVTFPGKQWETASPESQGLDSRKVAQAVEHVRSICGVRGADEVMIIRNGYVVYQGKNVTRLEPIYSCTKSFTSTCFGLMWDDGVMSPEDKLWKFTPELKELYPEMTIRQVLSLTSGYAGKKGNFFQPDTPAFAPGTKLEYGRYGVLVSDAISRTTGRSMYDIFMERLGGPIGIDPEEFTWGVARTVNGVKVNGGGGQAPMGVSMTARALARFGWLYANGGEWNGRQLISKRYIDLASTPQSSKDLPAQHPGRFDEALPGNYGLYWWTNGPRPNGAPHWPSATKRTFAAQGNKNCVCFIIPEWKMVVVRLGGDKIIPMDDYDGMFKLLSEAMKKSKAE